MRETTALRASLLIMFVIWGAAWGPQLSRQIASAVGTSVEIQTAQGFDRLTRSVGVLKPEPIAPRDVVYHVDPIPINDQVIHGRRCSADEIRHIASKRPLAQSICPDTSGWMNEFIEEAASDSYAFIVFVGCNKGYDVVAAARAWGNNASYSVADMVKLQATRIRKRHLGGACGTGNKPERPVKARPPIHIDALCIEPMASNFRNLQDAFSELGYNPQLRAIKAAVSSTIGVASFPQGQAGVESIGMSSTNAVDDTFALMTQEASEDQVQVITLDSEIMPLLLSEDKIVDFLSIDTEGNDVRVLLGSIRLLVEQRVRYLEFEYHSQNKWATSDLEDTVDFLDQLGYDCYFAGNKGQLWRLTSCWDPSYTQHKTWSNVACVSRSETDMHGRMDRISWAV